KGRVSFFTSQMISGPMKQPMLPAQPDVRMPPTSAERCANIAHWRSSAPGPSADGGTGGGWGGAVSLKSVIVVSPFADVVRVGRAGPSNSIRQSTAGDCQRPRAGVVPRRCLLPAGRRHPADQDRAGPDVRARVDVAADRIDPAEHRAQVASDGDAVKRMAR